jgi:DNA end-binding protein Ku
MPRAIWTGTISFGLVNIPVRVYPATRRKDVRFHEIDRVTGQRVHHQRVRTPWPDEPADWAPTEPGPVPSGEQDRLPAGELDSLPTGEQDSLPTRGEGQGGDVRRASPEVRTDEVVKGFEIAPDTFVTITEEEIEELRPERTRTIDIEEFVLAAEVDPIYFDTAYHVVPQREYERPFALLVEALASSGKLAVCWIVLRKRRHLAALRPYQGVLVLSTMYFADEVVPVAEVAPRPTEKPSQRELKMAALLVESMSGPFEPVRYEDGYRKRLLELIASRSGQAILAQGSDEPVATSGVEQLMAALEASLKQVRSTSRKRRAG